LTTQQYIPEDSELHLLEAHTASNKCYSHFWKADIEVWMDVHENCKFIHRLCLTIYIFFLQQDRGA
jgi:hypothetical protein